MCGWSPSPFLASLVRGQGVRLDKVTGPGFPLDRLPVTHFLVSSARIASCCVSLFELAGVASGSVSLVVPFLQRLERCCGLSWGLPISLQALELLRAGASAFGFLKSPVSVLALAKPRPGLLHIHEASRGGAVR